MFVEYQFHRLRVERLHGGQFQTLYHVHRAQLVLQEMLRLDVALIGFFRGIDFENANLCGVLGALHRKEADDSRLKLHALPVHFVGKLQVFLQMLRIYLDFS